MRQPRGLLQLGSPQPLQRRELAVPEAKRGLVFDAVVGPPTAGVDRQQRLDVRVAVMPGCASLASGGNRAQRGAARVKKQGEELTAFAVSSVQCGPVPNATFNDVCHAGLQK